MDVRTANLVDVLVELYDDPDKQKRVARMAGIPPGFLDTSGTPLVSWHKTVVEAERRDLVDAVVRAALRDYPGNASLLEFLEGRLDTVSGPNIRSTVHWQGPTDPGQLEKIIGTRSTIFDLCWLELGLARARPVAKVMLPRCSATGFLIEGDRLLTNHHVLPDLAAASEASVWFNYQRTSDGLDAHVDEYRTDPAYFRTSVENDWTVVGVAGNPSAKWGYLELERNPVAKGAYVVIIQHPGGRPKSIALYHNPVVFADQTRIQYLTDTEPGSSGSPVFDDWWRVVGLHHSGGRLPEPGTNDRHYRNQGIQIAAIVAELEGA